MKRLLFGKVCSNSLKPYSFYVIDPGIEPVKLIGFFRVEKEAKKIKHGGKDCQKTIDSNFKHAQI